MTASYLVTGGAGFVGRQLCLELLMHGNDVRVVDSLVPQVHSDGEVVLPGVAFFEGDLRDADLLDHALDGVEGVFHLAAEVGVGQSMYEIVRYVGGNDLATAVLLERLARRPVRRLVVASSMSVYGEGLYIDGNGGRHGGAARCRRGTGMGSCGFRRGATDAGADGRDEASQYRFDLRANKIRPGTKLPDLR